MSILNFLKGIKLPGFEDELIVDPVDQVSPEYSQQMGLLATIHREKERARILAEKTDDVAVLAEYEDSLDPASLSYCPTPSDITYDKLL